MAISGEKLVEVQNITDHIVGYYSFEEKRRVIPSQASIKVTAEELRALHFTDGGHVLLHESLSVKDKSLAKEFGISEDLLEHEYNWSEKDVEKVLTNGTLDELKDALDFAPQGIVDMIVSKAVELKINDIGKRDAIFEATGRNVDQMIKLVDQAAKDTEQPEQKPQRKRRATTKTTESAAQRRAAAVEEE